MRIRVFFHLVAMLTAFILCAGSAFTHASLPKSGQLDRGYGDRGFSRLVDGTRICLTDSDDSLFALGESLMKLDRNGSRVAKFGRRGVSSDLDSQNGRPYALAIDSDGRALVLVERRAKRKSKRRDLVIRLTNRGKRDRSFGREGAIDLGTRVLPSKRWNLVALSNGKTVAFRSTGTSTAPVSTVRVFARDGSRLNEFGENGRLHAKYEITAVAEHSADRLLLGGRTEPNGNGANSGLTARVSAVNFRGEPEIAWAQAGSAVFAGLPAEIRLPGASALSPDSFFGMVQDLRVLADGSIQVLAYSTLHSGDPTLAWSARLNANGAIDVGYGLSGFAFIADTTASAEGTYSAQLTTAQLADDGRVFTIRDEYLVEDEYSNVDISAVPADGRGPNLVVSHISGRFSAGSYALAASAEREIICGSSGKHDYAMALKL